WDGEVPFETVTMRFIADSTTKALALENGEIHVAENINAPTEVEKFKADDTIHVSETAGMRTGYAYINFQGVLANDDLRAAVLMALDNDTMCNTIVGGMYQPGFSILSSALAYGYDQLENPYAYDVDGAVARLDQAGIVDSNGDGIRELDGAPIILTYLVYANRSLPDLVEAISIQLAQIGIQVDVQLWDYDTLINLQTAGEFDLSASNMNTVAVGDPQEFLGNWYSSNSSSYGFYSNPEYDALYAQLTETLDNDQRTALIVQLQQILIDDGAALVHGYYTSRMFSRTEDVVGAEISVADYYWITTNMKQP
ncbi:MAG: ABC transporter substrate-binding protein, partial [Eubacteriales bacterium]